MHLGKIFPGTSKAKAIPRNTKIPQQKLIIDPREVYIIPNKGVGIDPPHPGKTETRPDIKTEEQIPQIAPKTTILVRLSEQLRALRALEDPQDLQNLQNLALKDSSPVILQILKLINQIEPSRIIGI